MRIHKLGTALVLVAAALILGPSAAGSSAVAPAGTGSWGDTATALRGQNGSQFAFVCPAGGSFGRLWGTGTFTDDSSICTAAVYAGRIAQAAGGVVTIQIAAGLQAYQGGEANGAQSAAYGPWYGSFTIAGAQAGGGSASVQMGGIGWGSPAYAYRGKNGSRYEWMCPANAAGTGLGGGWGTGTYTDDSSVCVMAVHAGLITLAGGGNVVIEIRPGASSYTGSARNGITTRSYGAFSGSYVFPASSGSQTTTTTTPTTAGTSWTATAVSYRGHNGTRLTYSCPAGGVVHSVWGTGSYTDDSSICTAAVHSGRITSANGGTVHIMVTAGRSAYAGSIRHGIASRSYGSWPGSFVFVS